MAKTVRDSWSKDRLRYRIKSQLKSSGGVVVIVTELMAERSGIRIPVRARDFPLLKNVQAAFAVNPASYSVCKGKAIPLQAWTGPEGSRTLRLPDFKDNRHMKVVRLSALRTGLLYPPGSIPGTHFS